MAAKEPTVERRHELLAEEALGPTEVLFQGEYSEAVDRVAQALATAEQATTERAWDEGYEAAGKVVHHGVNPYRQPKGPTE